MEELKEEIEAVGVDRRKHGETEVQELLVNKAETFEIGDL